MADIRMKREHGLEREDVQKRIEKLADKLASKLGGSWDWDGDDAVCEARGAKARVAYDDREIQMDVKLPMMLKPLRGKLESKIDEYFERYFG